MLKFAVPAWTFIALSLAAPSAWAQCATVDPVIVPQIRVDPLAASEATDLIQPLQLTFRRSGVGSAPVTLRYQIIDDDSSAIARVGLSQGPVIDWTSSDSSRSIGALRYEAYSLLRTGVVTIGDDDGAVQRSVTLRLGDVRSDIPAGVYREQFTVRYWCEAEEMGLPYESAGAIAVSVAVPNVLSASVAGASLRGEIDFMDFATLSRTLQVSVRSTGPYRVTARSENGSALVREGVETSPRASDRINYSADFAGEGLGLVSAAGARQMPRAGLTGRLIPLIVNIDNIKGKVAGRYFDTIYLTLEPAN
ncbi:MAG: hypothetical protein JWR59_2016 [Brevundimonas sp.]|nr:hypothetical protein [Brevundimonas sp.]